MRTSTIRDIQVGFTALYPYLSLDFYKYTGGRFGSSTRLKLNKSLSLESVGLKKDGSFQIAETLTVGSLEETFLKDFGLYVQVSRKSGTVWLETTMTDNWTLLQQNVHGQELSEPKVPDKERTE